MTKLVKVSMNLMYCYKAIKGLEVFEVYFFLHWSHKQVDVKPFIRISELGLSHPRKSKSSTTPQRACTEKTCLVHMEENLFYSLTKSSCGTNDRRANNKRIHKPMKTTSHHAQVGGKPTCQGWPVPGLSEREKPEMIHAT